MKLLHLSDLHIGLKLIDRDLTEDQKHVFRQVADACRREQPDAILIAGDIYDKSNPSGEAVALFDAFVSDLAEAAPNAHIMMISGNHDSALRVNVFRNILQRQKIHMIGLPPQTPDESIARVTLEDEHGPVHFYLLPFVKPAMIKDIVGTDENGLMLGYEESIRRLLARESVDTTVRNVLVSHQFYLPNGMDANDVDRMDNEVKTVGNIDEVSTDVLTPFDYAALGHIHKPMKVGSEVFRYCGTPMACSVSEAGQQKGIIKIELGAKGTVETSVIPLQPLHEIRVIRGTLEEVLQQSTEDYVHVQLTDKEDLDNFDTKERLQNAFCNLLDIERETYFSVNEARVLGAIEKQLDPFSLCQAFLDEMNEAETKIIQDLLNRLQGGN